MPRIVQYTESQSLPQSTGGVAQSPDLEARSSEQRRDAFTLVQNVADSYRDRRQRAEDESFISDTITQTLLDLDGEFKQQTSSRGQNPQGFSDDFRKFAQDKITSAVDSARTPEIGQVINDRLQGRYISYGVAAADYENTQIAQNMKGTLDKNIDNLQKVAFASGGKLESLDRIVEDGILTVKGAESFLSPDQYRAYVKSTPQMVYGAGIDALINESPYEANRQLTAGKWDDKLTAKQLIQAKKTAAQRVIQEGQRAWSGFQDRANDVVAAVGAGVIRPESPEAVAIVSKATELRGAEYGARIAEKIERAGEYGQVKKDIAGMTIDEQNSYLAAVNAQLQGAEAVEGFRDKVEFVNMVQSAVAENQKLMMEDPFTAAARTPGIDATDIDAIITEQRRRGVAKNDVSVMPAAMAKREAMALSNYATPEDIMAHLQTRRAQYETLDKYQSYLRDLTVRGKASMALSEIAHMDPIQDIDQIHAQFHWMKQGEKEFKDRFEKSEIDSLKTAVRDNLSDYFSAVNAVPGSLRESNIVEKSAINRAMVLMTQGHTVEEAAERAAAPVTQSMNVGEVNGNKFLIPKNIIQGDSKTTVSAEFVEDSAEKYLGQIVNSLRDKKDNLLIDLPEGTNIENWADVVEESGQWVTLDDESGLQFHVMGIPQTRKGKLIQLRFKDLLPVSGVTDPDSELDDIDPLTLKWIGNPQ